MQKKDAKELLEKYHSGICTEEEKALLESWYLQWKDGEFDLSSLELKETKDHIWEQMVESQKKVKRVPLWNRYVAASIVFAVLSLGAILYLRKEKNQYPEQITTTTNIENDVAPGGNKAILTLADGTVVSLDDAKDGKIAEATGINIRKTADGQVVYETSTANDAGALAKEQTLIKYNQISTPRGGQYQVILPDGTKVWLNAASSLRYPIQFAAQERHVELTGEAYFEVNKQQSVDGNRIPFIVSTPSQTVEVLGTHFNINSYEDESAVKTTLIEGSVRVSPKTQGMTRTINDGILLKPDQQAELIGNELQVKKVNTEEIIAWKNGYFSFDHADLETVMRQLSRWYDVDVVYAGEIPGGTYSGKVYRDMTISKVLEVLAYAQIDFKIEGKKMIITH